jgi:AcrR family transcriptional regulator
VTQKVSFTKEMVVDAAFELTREIGWESVTARNIARKLGSSTMPIYSTVKSIEEIEMEVMEKALALMVEYQKKPFTPDPMINLAVGYVVFARDEHNLFAFLYRAERPVPDGSFNADARRDFFNRSFSGVPGVGEALKEIPADSMDSLMLKSWIFTHGLAVMTNSGILDLPDGKIAELVTDAGGAFYMYKGGSP